ncbi:hypothetical protein [Azospirillum sp. sgz301742]
MAEGSIGPSDLTVRPAKQVERSGSATDRRPRREQQDQKEASDRRRKEPPNPRRRRVYEMLFDEVDQIDSLSVRQRTRVKENLRNHIAAAPPPPPPAETPPPEHDEENAAEQLLSDPQTAVSVDPDHIVHAAAPAHPHLTLTEAEENRILAEQLRVCLAQHTERARKLAVYLHMLLRMSGTVRPTMVLDV